MGGEGDQGAGERSLRGTADEGRPSGDPGGPGGGLEGMGDPARLCMGQGADGVDRLCAEPAAEFQPEDQQAAAIGAGEFRGERRSGHGATVAAGVPSCVKGGHQGAIDRQLGAVVEGEADGDDLDAPVIVAVNHDVEVPEEDIGADGRPRFAEDPCHGAFQGRGAGAKGPGSRAGGPAVAQRIMLGATAACGGCEGQGAAQAPQHEEAEKGRVEGVFWGGGGDGESLELMLTNHVKQ
eukprot:s3147_g21.t1